MPDPSLLDRFEEHLTEEADELTATKWTPFLAAQVPQALRQPGTDHHLKMMLRDLRDGGLTIPRMQWAAWEARRAEEQSLSTVQEWTRDLLRRALGEADFREVWTAVAQQPPPGFEEDVEVVRCLEVRRHLERMLGGTGGLAQLSEEARLDGGEPGRN